MEAASARQEVLEALCKLPEHARRFALEHVTFVGLGDVGGDQCVVGVAVGPRRREGTEWVVPLMQREGIGATLAHELAHAMAGDEVASCEAEVRAVAQANRWGFSDGDPAEHAARFERRQRSVTTRARLSGDTMSMACTCGTPCRVWAPAVPGMKAEVGLGCRRCGWVETRSVDELCDCPSCHCPLTAVWTEDATPSAPRATWTCSACGATATVALPTAPEEVEATPEVQDVRAAASELMGAEETLRRLGGSRDLQHALAVESCRVGMVFAGQRLRRAAAAFGSDPQASVLLGMADEVGLAVAEFVRRDDFSAADLAARIAHALNAMSAGPGLRVRGEE